MPTDPDDILADIQRVADELGKAPSTDDYKEHGEYTTPTVYKYFESFVTAREKAGVAKGRLRPNSREELLDDIRRVADDVDGEPSWDDYVEHGDYAIKGIQYRFDTWLAAKQEAGVYKRENHELTKTMLIEDMQRVDDEQSGALSQVTYDEHGKWTSMAVKRSFESWESACQQAGVTRPDKGPRTESSQELLADIRDLAEELERLPSRAEYNQRGDFSRQMAINRFGSWNDAVREAGFEPRTPGPMTGEDAPNWRGGYEPYYGASWAEQRRKARRRDEYSCVVCGMTEEQHKDEYGWELEVHHIKPFRKCDDHHEANDLENLATVCREHHSEYETLGAKGREKLRKLI